MLDVELFSDFQFREWASKAAYPQRDSAAGGPIRPRDVSIRHFFASGRLQPGGGVAYALAV
jgi:hypothetical protein